ncbi:MAG: hydroxymethylpyrimidine/phosphomethylpyrimidine kinase [Candidatus Eremiobacteraeota bacterium]|nr:hydroxymethylpyrimidine/phosphomethylpyrimidine kinase [Candidatus Eremiobacteraeota bacterium]
MKPPVVASIGSTHPWNIAGVGLDALICARYDVRHVVAIAGVSAQDAGGVHALHAIPPHVLQAQLAALPPASAYCVGALPDAATVRVIAGFLDQRRDSNVVVDPVFAATLGGELVDAAGVEAFRTLLATLPVVLTPNRSEAERLLGRAVTFESAPAAARELQRRGPRAVLLKGGHFEGPVRDIVVEETTTFFEEARLLGSMRGAGGSLACALACELALGKELMPAVIAARRFVRERIAAGTTFEGLQVAF